MSYAQEIQRLKEISPYSLPLNTAESGLSAEEIRERNYAGLFYLLELLEEARNAAASGDDSLSDAIDLINTTLIQMRADINALDLSSIEAIQAAISELGTLTTNQGNSIATLQTAATTLNTAISTLRNDIVNGVITAYKANRDGDGNIIKNTYAKQVDLTATNGEITKIKNGTTTVGKAAADKDGNAIDQTYVKKSQVVNSLDSTTTNLPLSAYQGKVLNDLITSIQTLLASNDTDLDTIQEIVTYIKGNKSLIDGITTNKVNVSDIIDGLTSEIANKPLSAKQGYVLKGLIDELASDFADMKDDFDDLDDKWTAIYEDYHTTAVKVNELSGGIVALTYSDECEQVIDNNDGTLDLVFN